MAARAVMVRPAVLAVRVGSRWGVRLRAVVVLVVPVVMPVWAVTVARARRGPVVSPPVILVRPAGTAVMAVPVVSAVMAGPAARHRVV
jgi:hypothetical protein